MKSTMPKSGHSSTEGTPSGESRRARRRRQRRESEPATPAPRPETSGSGSKSEIDDTPSVIEVEEQLKSQRSEFDDGADYIAFGFEGKDDQDTESVAVYGKDKGKGKARETSRERVRDRKPETTPERQEERRDGRRERERERSRERRDKDGGRERRDTGRTRDRDRDLDRDADSRGTKRKKDLYDLNDGYANKKQRLDAASRKSPWVADLDWTRCRHVAELCVFCFWIFFPA